MRGQIFISNKSVRWARQCLAWLMVASLAVVVALPLLAVAQRPAVAPLAQAGTIRFEPASVSVPAGQTVTLHIMLDDVEDYYGIDLRFSFDPALVMAPTSMLTMPGEVFDPVDRIVVKNEVDNVAGTAWLSVTNLNPAEPFSGSGRVCDVTFQALSDGVAPLTFTYVKGSSRDADPLFPVQVNGTLSVGNADPTPEPTATSYPIGLRDEFNAMLPMITLR